MYFYQIRRFVIWLLMLIFPASLLSLIGIVSSTAKITLVSNPTTGYEWVLYSEEILGDTCEDCGDVIALSDTITSLKSNGLVGGSTLTTIYVYEALRPGDVMLTYRLVQPWDGGDIAEVRAYHVHVDKELMLTTVTRVTPKPSVELKGANPCFGKTWRLDAPNDIVKVFDYYYTPGMNLGDMGTYSFAIIGITEGTCRLSFSYSGKEDAESTAAFDIAVDAELNVTIAPVTATLYQLAAEDSSLMQCYVIKTGNGKLIVIDGGVDGVGKDNAPYLPAALRAIAGVGNRGYFEVEAWFLSHAHSDHIYELSKMLKEYSNDSGYKIKNIYFDFPDMDSAPYKGTDVDLAKTNFVENFNKYGQIIGAEVKEGSTYYDYHNGAVINEEAVKNGLSFEYDSVKIDILQTRSISDGTSNFNDTSLVIKMWVDGQSVLFLNDLGVNGGNRLLATYGDKLKSDIVQMAHHGQNGITKEVYDIIGAKVHLWPTPIWVWKNEGGIYQIDQVKTWLYGETFLDASESDIVSCLYDEYPTNIYKASSWRRVIDGMKIELPYAPAE